MKKKNLTKSSSKKIILANKSSIIRVKDTKKMLRAEPDDNGGLPIPVPTC